MGNTALHACGLHGNDTVTRVLLTDQRFTLVNHEGSIRFGAFDSAWEADGMTALHCAALAGNEGVCKALLESSRFHDAPDHNPLRGMSSSRIECATKLIDGLRAQATKV